MSPRSDEVVVCFPFVGDSVGGAQLSARLLIRNLRPPFRPLVVVHRPGPLTQLFDDDGIPYRLAPLAPLVGESRGVAHLVDIARTTLPVRRFLRREGVDLVHGQDGRINLTWTLPARLAGIPYIWHQRSMYAPSRLVATMLRLANRVVCISEFCRSGMPRGACVVVDNPFDTETTPPPRAEARARLGRELGIPEGHRVVGFVGNLTEQKRPAVFVDAAAWISGQSSTPVSFVMVGADRKGLGDETGQRAAALGIGARLHMAGFRFPADGWIAGCDVLLAPEVDDAFGRTLVEAMLTGTPVVASRSGGHPEIIDHGVTGMLSPADDAAAMAAMALELLTDLELAQRVSREARQQATRRYSAAAHAERMMALYRDAAGSILTA